MGNFYAAYMARKQKKSSGVLNKKRAGFLCLNVAFKFCVVYSVHLFEK